MCTKVQRQQKDHASRVLVATARRGKKRFEHARATKTVGDLLRELAVMEAWTPYAHEKTYE